MDMLKKVNDFASRSEEGKFCVELTEDEIISILTLFKLVQKDARYGFSDYPSFYDKFRSRFFDPLFHGGVHAGAVTGEDGDAAL